MVATRVTTIAALTAGIRARVLGQGFSWIIPAAQERCCAFSISAQSVAQGLDAQRLVF
jgi:hypothetical protein